MICSWLNPVSIAARLLIVRSINPAPVTRMRASATSESMVKLVLKKTNARTGRNPATGQPIPIAAKTVVKARIVKQLKDAVLPKKTV